MALTGRGSISPISIPPFVGATRTLLLWNLVCYFVLAVLGVVLPMAGGFLVLHLGFSPALVLRGQLWQPLTYSFLNSGLVNVIFAMMTLWYTGNLLEESFGSRWLYQAYFVSAAGGALLAVPLAYLHLFGISERMLEGGCWAAIFGLLVALGVFFGEREITVMFVLRMKVKVMVTLYILLFTAEMATQHDGFNAMLQLCGGLAGFLYCRLAPRRGFAAGVAISERWYGLRNAFYRNKRRQAAKKFEVYMGKQGRAVRFDKDGRYVEQDEPVDKRWMN